MLLAVMQKLTFRFRDVAKAKSNLKIWPMEDISCRRKFTGVGIDTAPRFTSASESLNRDL